MNRNYFPLGIVTGPSFCNRVTERQQLSTNIQHIRHTWLMAPRRYGKTSLIQQTIKDLEKDKTQQVISLSIDLLIAYDESTVQNIILDAVGELIAKIIPTPNKAFNTLSQLFKLLRPEVTLSDDGFKVRFSPTEIATKNIVNALQGLDSIAREQNVIALFVADEFQQIGTLKGCEHIEASIRHAVERSTHVAYVFSGSHRHLLAKMFEDSSRPLYHLCTKMGLHRIKEEDYTAYFQKVALKRWNKNLSEPAIKKIIELTERHPYYVNSLCAKLWSLDRLPSAKIIERTWFQYVEEERYSIIESLRTLSPNQKAVLVNLAKDPTAQPRSKKFLSRSRLASTSAGQAVQTLLERDLLYEDNKGVLKVLAPTILCYLNRGNNS